MLSNRIIYFIIVLASIIQTEFSMGQTPSSQLPPTANTTPNIILITIDSLRADHVSCLGYDRNTTPNFDAFAQNNILFTNAFATSGWMLPTHASIFTSLYPKDHNTAHISHTLGDQHHTLAEILHENGYYCAGFCCNPRISRNYGFAQGFDIFDDYTVSLILEGLMLDEQDNFDINVCRTNGLINDTAISWLQNNTQQPFFLFVHYYDNHWDYLPPEPYNQMYDPDYTGEITGKLIAREPLFSNPPSNEDIDHIIALYDGEVRLTDEDLGDMLRYLEEASLMDNSIIIILSDHGEQFYEHGHTSHHGVYDELIHIPLAMSIPNRSLESQTINGLVSQVDILPTILDYLSINPPTNCAGTSMRPLIENHTNTINDYIFAEYTGGGDSDAWIIRTLQYKCYEMADSPPHAFDMLHDHWEQDQIPLPDFNEQLTQLHNVLQQWRTSP